MIKGHPTARAMLPRYGNPTYHGREVLAASCIIYLLDLCLLHVNDSILCGLLSSVLLYQNGE
jgi:hypothetical protein